MLIKQIIANPEGRRLEFKAILPKKSDLAKTIVAFANDAGGELYIGIQNNPREITGLPEEELMGIIDQWGNGLKLIADELKDYPNIGLRWKEVGLSFQVQFVKLNYVEEQEWEQVGIKSGLSWEQVLLVLSHYEIAQDTKSLMQKMGLSNRTKFKNKYINPLIDEELLEMTIPDKPNSSLQKYRITNLGKQLKENLESK